MSRKWIHSTSDYPKEYDAWKAARRRCTNPASHRYSSYGSRGITMCERWQKSFDAFMFDMGRCPPGLTLERIEVEDGYDPFNCVWASWEAQYKNTRKAIAKRERPAPQPRQKIPKPAKALYHAPDPQHGSKRMYQKHKCRCEICTAAYRERQSRKAVNRAGTPEYQAKLAYLKSYRRRPKLQYDL